MRVFVLTLGSRGDVKPYVALGEGLIKEGHQVTICTSSSFEGFITERGLGYGYMNGGILKLIDTDAGRGAVEDSGNILGWVRTMLALTKQGLPQYRNLNRR